MKKTTARREDPNDNRQGHGPRGSSGAPISPLLANLYMRRFVLGWKRRGLEARLRAKIVVYADDLVICCRGNAEEAMSELRRLMMQFKLTRFLFPLIEPDGQFSRVQLSDKTSGLDAGIGF